VSVRGGRESGPRVLGVLALGLTLALPGVAEAKRIKIRARPDLSPGWALSRTRAPEAPAEAAAVSTSPPSRAEAAEARARAALAAERTLWRAARTRAEAAGAEPASPEGGVVCIAGC
jgi:hypothetical protein